MVGRSGNTGQGNHGTLYKQLTISARATGINNTQKSPDCVGLCNELTECTHDLARATVEMSRSCTNKTPIPTAERQPVR